MLARRGCIGARSCLEFFSCGFIVYKSISIKKSGPQLAIFYISLSFSRSVAYKIAARIPVGFTCWMVVFTCSGAWQTNFRTKKHYGKLSFTLAWVYWEENVYGAVLSSWTPHSALHFSSAFCQKVGHRICRCWTGYIETSLTVVFLRISWISPV